jgi:hypothetical protein
MQLYWRFVKSFVKSLHYHLNRLSLLVDVLFPPVILPHSQGKWFKGSQVSPARPSGQSSYLLIHLLTPWSRVLLEKLTGSAVSEEIPRIFGTWRFITVLTSARHLSLSWANSIQSPHPPHMDKAVLRRKYRISYPESREEIKLRIPIN